MPIFEYRCSACGHKFEDLRAQSEADEARPCPRCGQVQAERVLSPFACATPGPSFSGTGSCGSGRQRGG